MTITSETTGVTKNLSIILDAVDYIGTDAYVEYDSTTKDYNVAKVIGPDKVIMDTGYLSYNEILGLHETVVVWGSNIAEEDNGLVLEYWWRDADGTEDNYSIDLKYYPDYSSSYGGLGGNAWFFENLEYRIVIKSHGDVNPGEYVWVDYIKFVLKPINNASSSSVVVEGEDVPWVQKEFWGEADATANNNPSGYVTVQFTTVPAYFVVVPTPVVHKGGFIARISDYTINSFTIKVHKVSEAAWTGAITCWYVGSVFYGPIPLKTS